jgi:hypothetical protein
MKGLKLAIIYGFKPHELGCCGPEKKETSVLLNYLHGQKEMEASAREILSQFKRAYAFYQLIAKSNGITDPFDSKVVEAYWIGSALLEKVKLDDLKKMVIDEYPKIEQIAPEAIKRLANKIPAGALAHHSFQVLFNSGHDSEEIDLCLIGWGVVKSVNGNKLIVKIPASSNKKNEGRKIIFWDTNLLPKVKNGDWVSFHWNCACQVLTKNQVKNLEKYTKNNLAVFKRRI